MLAASVLLVVLAVESLAEEVKSPASPANASTDSANVESQSDKENGQEQVAEIQKAAEAGDAAAQAELGRYLFFGVAPIQKDVRLAATWFRKSALQGDHNGQYMLGNCFHTGIGEQQNDEQARKYFLLAAEQGDGRAYCDLGVMADAKKGVEKSMAVSTAVDYWRKGRELGDPNSCYNLGYKYFTGSGVRRSVPLAMQCFEEAGDKSAPALYLLGLCYSQPEIWLRLGETKSRALALKSYRLSASLGDTRAVERLKELGEKP